MADPQQVVAEAAEAADVTAPARVLSYDIFSWHNLIYLNNDDSTSTWKEYLTTFLGLATTVTLAWWLSSAIPGLDMAIALLLLSTPKINFTFLTLCMLQLLYRGRDYSPTARTKKLPKMLRKV